MDQAFEGTEGGTRPPQGQGGGAAGGASVGTAPRFLHRVTLVLALSGVFLGIVLLLWFQIHLLLLGFTGLLIAVFLYSLSQWLHQWTKMPYWLALLVVCLVVLGLLFGAGWLVGARVTEQAAALKEQLPAAWRHARGQMVQSPTGRWLLDRLQDVGNSFEQQSLVQPGLGLISSTGVLLAEVFTVVFVGLFGAISPQIYVRGAMRVVPLARRPLARQLLTESAGILWWWMIGQLVAMAFIGLITGIAVWLLGVPLALTLGLLAALLNFIPNFGPIIAAVPALLLALTVSPMTALWIVVVYIAIQLLQNHVVTPLVQQTAVRLPPVVLILAQILMYYWAGLLGMAMAPALAAVAIHVVEVLYVRRVVGDPVREGQGFWPEGA